MNIIFFLQLFHDFLLQYEMIKVRKSLSIIRGKSHKKCILFIKYKAQMYRVCLEILVFYSTICFRVMYLLHNWQHFKLSITPYVSRWSYTGMEKTARFNFVTKVMNLWRVYLIDYLQYCKNSEGIEKYIEFICRK